MFTLRITYKNLGARLSYSCKNMSKQLSPNLPVCEVERKFEVPNDYHERLEGQGFKLIKTHNSILDVYYDILDTDKYRGKLR